jgi:O-antigen ligase
VFGPGIILHPHDGALQIWLELGAVGAVLAAAFWFLTLRRLTREARDLGAVAVAASCAVYLLFGALNFGVWQEWWLALGALVAVGAALLDGATPASRST